MPDPASNDLTDLSVRLGQLTKREREILAMLADGLGNREISRRLERTLKTVETHLSSVRRKLGVRDRVRLALIAARAGIGSAEADGGTVRERPSSAKTRRAELLALREEIARNAMASNALRAIDAATSPTVGTEFLAALVSALGSALRLEAAAMYEIVHSGADRRLRCVAATSAGEPLVLPELPIAGTALALAWAVAPSVISIAADDPLALGLIPDPVESPSVTVALLRNPADDALIGAIVAVGDGPLDRRLDPELILGTTLGRASAELARLHSGAKFNVIVESSVDMISVHSATGAYTYASPSCEDLLGYSPRELIGKSAYDFMDSRDISGVGTVHHEILTKAGQVRVRYALHRKDGTRVRVESQTRAVRDAAGEITALVVVTREIGTPHGADFTPVESRVAEQSREVSNAESRWRAMLAAVEEFVVVVDQDLRIVYVNRTLPDTDVDSVVGTSVDQYIDSAHGHVTELIREVIRTGKPRRTEVESVTPAGRIRWASRISPLVQDGAIRGAICVARDLSGVREIESAMLESERRYRMLFEDSPEGLLVHDGDRVRMANRLAAELLGYDDPAHLINVPVMNLVEPEFRSIVRARVVALLRGTSSQPRMRQQLLRPDGTTVSLEVAARACLYQGGPAVQTSMRRVNALVVDPAATSRARSPD